MSTISLRLEDELAKEFKEVCGNMWFTVSAMLKWMINKITKERRVEFTELTENWFTPQYEKEILDYVNSESYKNGDEDVFIAETPDDTRRFFKTLMN